MNDISEITLILQSKNHLKHFEFVELNHRVQLLLDRGFIYNPYSDKFFNPFFDNLSKVPSRLLSNSKWKDYLISLDPILTYIRKYRKNDEEITQKYNLETNHFLIYIEVYSGIIGIFIFLSGLVSFFFLSLNITIILNTISFLFIKYYFLSNGLKTNYFGRWSIETSPFWRKNKNIFLIVLFINFFVFLFFLYLLIQKIFFTLIIGVIFHFVSNELFTIIEEKKYVPITIFRTLYDDDYIRKFKKTLDGL
jgi:hypothetical protein